MTRYPLYRSLGGPQGLSGQVRKISPTTGIRSPDRPARSESLYRLSYPRAMPVMPLWAFMTFSKVNFTCCIPFQLRVKYVYQLISHVCSEIIMRYSASSFVWTERLDQCFSTAGPRPGTGPWHQLYRAARSSPGICHFSFLSNFHA